MSQHCNPGVRAASVDPMFPASPFESYPVMPARPNTEALSSTAPATVDQLPIKSTAISHTLPKHAADLDMDVLTTLQLDRSQLTIGEELGSGFFGTVNIGTYTDDKGTRDVAVKAHVLLQGTDKVETAKQRRVFMLEAQILSEFSNPHGA